MIGTIVSGKAGKDRRSTAGRLAFSPGLRWLGILVGLWAWAGTVSADDWPQWLGPQRDGVWRETGVVEKFPTNGLAVQWRSPIGSGYTGPAVARGRVYVMDRLAVTNGPDQERVLCLDEANGKTLWRQDYACAFKISYPAGPRATPAVAQDKVYTLGAMGYLACWDAAAGTNIWSHDLPREYRAKIPMWGFAGHPLVDGEKLICLVGGEDSCVMAFDKHTGRELWRALDAKEPGYCPPMIYEAGGCRQLIVWHPEAVNSIDPETGKLYWTVPFSSKAGLSIATPRISGDSLFVTTFYNGSLLLRLANDQPRASVAWQSRVVDENKNEELHSIISTPFLEDGYVYGVCSYGQFRCLKLADGERLWESFAPTTGQSTRWGNAFIVKHGNRFFLWNEKGDLIIARLSPRGYEEVSRTHLLEPTNRDAGRLVVWSHPAFANRSIYVRNDRELIRVSLAEDR